MKARKFRAHERDKTIDVNRHKRLDGDDPLKSESSVIADLRIHDEMKNILTKVMKALKIH